jgi:hypothetical protein
MPPSGAGRRGRAWCVDDRECRRRRRRRRGRPEADRWVAGTPHAAWCSMGGCASNRSPRPPNHASLPTGDCRWLATLVGGARLELRLVCVGWLQWKANACGAELNASLRLRRSSGPPELPAAAVSQSCAWIGSLCLRHRVHGASIGACSRRPTARGRAGSAAGRLPGGHGPAACTVHHGSSAGAAAAASIRAAALTEIYLRGLCSCQETLRRHGRAQATPPSEVRPLLAWIGSPCLRHCVHGAPIGGDAAAAAGARPAPHDSFATPSLRNTRAPAARRESVACPPPPQSSREPPPSECPDDC